MVFSLKTIAVFSFLAIFFVLTPLKALAVVDVVGQDKEFFVDSDYDLQGREEVSAKLWKITDEAYFYIEEEWYDNLTEGEKEKASGNLEKLSSEFSQVIYPGLTESYGEEWNPGIDSNKHITILFHRMANEAAGYFKTQDETSRLQNVESNEREMVYLNSYYLLGNLIKSYLSHEFTHVITFNQKERIRRVEEEVWLNELRAEYAATLLGYDDIHKDSNLEQRINIFLDYPSDSLTEWTNKPADYGVINAFASYLTGNYGEEILSDSLKNSYKGISSIEQSLKDNYVRKEFWEIFSDWLVASFLNDCRKNTRHCYSSQNLKYIKISPSLIFLPPNQKTEFSISGNTTYWAGNWYRLIGGAEKLEVVFQGSDRADFKVPYVLCKASYDCSVDFLEITDNQEGRLAFDDFNKEYTSLTLIPFAISKTIGFNGEEERLPFSIKAAATPKNTKQELIDSLKARILEIQRKIAVLQQELVKILAREGKCLSITQDLYFGVRSGQVECLQRFLSQQGSEIYPDGLITGYFGQLTREAVIRFQEKYASEVLHPLGITKATGYVGASTRSKINELTVVRPQ